MFPAVYGKAVTSLRSFSQSVARIVQVGSRAPDEIPFCSWSIWVWNNRWRQRLCSDWGWSDHPWVKGRVCQGQDSLGSFLRLWSSKAVSTTMFSVVFNQHWVLEPPQSVLSCCCFSFVKYDENALWSLSGDNSVHKTKENKQPLSSLDGSIMCHYCWFPLFKNHSVLSDGTNWKSQGWHMREKPTLVTEFKHHSWSAVVKNCLNLFY